jgi:subtilisin family serine protease
MKKSGILIMIILSMFLFAMIPMNRTNASTGLDVPMNVMIFREELAENFVQAAAVQSLPEVIPFWVDMVDADLVPNEGEGVYIAVLDTGLLPEWPFFFSQANIRDDLGIGFRVDIWWDDSLGTFVRGPLYVSDFITKVPEGSGHGTHVVSTIVGFNVNNWYWVRGIAPKAQIIPVLVLDAWNVSYPGGYVLFAGGFFDQVAAGIYYVADLAGTLDGPVILSMSLGAPIPHPLIEDAINYAIGKGVIVVASAGNAGYAGMSWPGAYPQVISCGMAGWTEQFLAGPTWWRAADVPEKLNTHDYWGNNWQLYLHNISSRPNVNLGQLSWYLDVTTPGAAIVGPYKPYFSYATGYYYLWGTSMAAPHVSGIAAIVLQSKPYLTQSTLEGILKTAAAKLPLPSDGSWVWDPWYGVYHFEWYGTDWGSGFLQADTALYTNALGKTTGTRIDF